MVLVPMTRVLMRSLDQSLAVTDDRCFDDPRIDRLA